jgi:acetylornithine/N-succinyldiaminopimelate aminotransferase
MVKGFEPVVPGFDHLPFFDLAEVRAAVGPETAAILIEPILGEGGIRALTTADLRGLRALCDETGTLLILDEVQCGMGRTGKLFHHEWAGITPDIMTVAKGIGGGFPLGACLATEAAAAGMGLGTHGSTYGGNPLACAVGVAVMDAVTAPGFLDNVSRIAGRLRRGLEGLVAAHPQVFESVRGEGLMLGLKCRVPNTDVVRAGYNARVLVVAAADNVVRLLPALNITEAEVDEGLRRLEDAASAVGAKVA